MNSDGGNKELERRDLGCIAGFGRCSEVFSHVYLFVEILMESGGCEA